MDEVHGVDRFRASFDRALRSQVDEPGDGISLDAGCGSTGYPRVLIVHDASDAPEVLKAAHSALTALGYLDSDLVFLAASVDSRDERVRGLVETLDPEAIVTVTDEAARLVDRVFPPAGDEAVEPRRSAGRRIVHVGDFAGALASDESKREAWERFKSIAPRGPVY